jgi:hypothetical protein
MKNFFASFPKKRRSTGKVSKLKSLPVWVRKGRPLWVGRTMLITPGML